MSTVGRKDFALVIGKGPAYTATTVNTLANGDVAIVKRDMTLYDSTADTPTTTDEFFIAQGTANGIKFVGPIQIKNVKAISAKTKVSDVEQVTHVGNVGSGAKAIVVANSTEYTLHVVLKHDKELGSERTPRFSYSYTSDASATQQEIADAFVAKINGDESLSLDVVAATVTSGGNYGFSITGKALSYDPVLAPTYRKVSFEVFVEDGFIGTPVTYTTAMNPGEGQYEQIRELEYTVQGYDGFTNRRLFPVLTPASDAVVGTEYDVIVLDYTNVHQGGTMEQLTQSRSTAFIALPTASAAVTQVKLQLNDIFAGTFATI